jgi:hypothetical protein
MWRGRVRDLKILTELDEAVPKNPTKNFARKIGGRVLKPEAGRYGVDEGGL